MRRLDPWLMDNFYVSFEDIMSGDIDMSTIEAWAEALIDFENNEFYMMAKNESLPMDYYRQTFDEKYEQLMANIANMLVDWFKDMMDGGDGGWDWGNDNSTTTTTSMPPMNNSLLNRIRSLGNGRAKPEPKPQPKSQNGKIGRQSRTNNQANKPAKKATIGGRLVRVALGLLKH